MCTRCFKEAQKLSGDVTSEVERYKMQLYPFVKSADTTGVGSITRVKSARLNDTKILYNSVRQVDFMHKFMRAARFRPAF